MSKKILVINGSPRKNGNTEMLADSFIEGAKQSGHEVTKFNICKMKINPCIGCLKSSKDKNSPCSQKDDMDKIYSAYNEADIIVFASPLYYWSFTAQIKAVIDRLFAVAEANNMKMPFKNSIMLIAAEDASKANFAPIVSYYETIINYLGWKDIGKILAGGVYQIGDIKGKPSLEEAKKLGIGIA